jgi:hypothetical protein
MTYYCVLCHKRMPKDIYCLNCGRRVCFQCFCNCWVKFRGMEVKPKKKKS